MQKRIAVNHYHNSLIKRTFDLLISSVGIVLFFPVILIIALLIKLTSGRPIFFRQRREGLKGKIFDLIKFRTMIVGADREQKKYMHLNEADGPVFKIQNDPRYTKIGKILAQTGLDELLQLINVLKGEMSLVGPRPLPVYEATKLTKAQKARELVKPGITSSWVVRGSHKLKFREWMRLDREYVENAAFYKDLKIIFQTATMIIKSILRQIS